MCKDIFLLYLYFVYFKVNSVMLSFDKIVKKMWRKCWKIMFKDDFFEFIDPEKKWKHQKQLDRLIYRLKSEWYILSLKAGVYVVPTEEDLKLNTIDLLEKYYFVLLQKYIRQTVWSQYFISGKKSLEYHLKNYSIPEKIYIINRDVKKKIIFGNYEIIFKTISGKTEGKTINLYSKFSNFTELWNIWWVKLKFSNLEMSLLETALVSDSYEGIQLTLLNQAIKKYSKVLHTEVFYEIWKYKYIMSFNRLKEVSRFIDADLTKIFIDIIKKNGGLFIGEWLRGI